MATIESETSIGGESGGHALVYDGFISYSHAEGEFAQTIEISPSTSLDAMNPRATNLVVVETNSWEESVTVTGRARIRGLSFSPDETQLAVGDIDSLYIVDLASGLIVQQLRLPGVSDIHWQATTRLSSAP